LTPEVHIFTESKLSWFTLPDSAPAFDVYYDRHALWPAASLERLDAVLAQMGSDARADARFMTSLSLVNEGYFASLREAGARVNLTRGRGGNRRRGSLAASPPSLFSTSRL
jgi:hypothetical protein